MDEERRERFKRWFEQTYKGPDARARFMQKTGLTKGRVSQLFDPTERFGEDAAKRIALAAGLKEDAFLRDPPPGEWHPHILRLAEGLSKIKDDDARETILLGAQAQVDRQLERQKQAEEAMSRTSRKRGPSR